MEETKNVPKCFDPPKRGAKVSISIVTTTYFLFNCLILPYLYKSSGRLLWSSYGFPEDNFIMSGAEKKFNCLLYSGILFYLRPTG